MKTKTSPLDELLVVIWRRDDPRAALEQVAWTLCPVDAGAALDILWLTYLWETRTDLACREAETARLEAEKARQDAWDRGFVDAVADYLTEMDGEPMLAADAMLIHMRHLAQIKGGSLTIHQERLVACVARVITEATRVGLNALPWWRK